MSAPEAESVEFRHYVLALFDILNQSALLRRLESLPFDEHDPRYPQYLDAAKKTIGTIDWFRKSVTDLFEIFRKGTPEGELWRSTLSDAQRSELSAYDTVDLHTHCFSDLITMFSPLKGPGERLSIRGLYAILCTCAAMIMVGLAGGVAIRGAIEVGIGVESWPGEIYGPVLFNAHRLESTVAQYPRIVVGPAACEYITTMAAMPSTGPADQISAVTAQICRSLVCIDHDGVAIVDFLGKGFRQIQGEFADQKYPTNADCVSKGLAFVKKEHERFKKEGNNKLALRYALLRQYYESRKHLWL